MRVQKPIARPVTKISATESSETPQSSRSCSDSDRSASELLQHSPKAILGILRSACTATPDPRLGLVLECLRTRWLVYGYRRYRNLGGGLEDAAQTALMRLVSGDKLATLRETRRLEAWARSFFIHAVLDLVRERRRHDGGSVSVGTSGDEVVHALLDVLPDDKPTPEELASYRERLAIVARAVRRPEVWRLKFVEDLPEKEIARRCGLTRGSVAAELKRVRKALRSRSRMATVAITSKPLPSLGTGAALALVAAQTSIDTSEPAQANTVGAFGGCI